MPCTTLCVVCGDVFVYLLPYLTLEYLQLQPAASSLHRLQGKSVRIYLCALALTQDTESLRERVVVL